MFAFAGHLQLRADGVPGKVCPLGAVGKPSVDQGNLQVARSGAWCLLVGTRAAAGTLKACVSCTCLNMRSILLTRFMLWFRGHWILENPVSSLLFHHPRAVEFCWDFPACSLAPTHDEHAGRGYVVLCAVCARARPPMFKRRPRCSDFL